MHVNVIAVRLLCVYELLNSNLGYVEPPVLSVRLHPLVRDVQIACTEGKHCCRVVCVRLGMCDPSHGRKKLLPCICIETVFP